MKQTIFKMDVVDLILSDHSNNAFKIAEKLKKYKLFDRVIYVEYKKTESEAISKITDLFDVAKMFLKVKKTELNDFFIRKKVDELISFNMDVIIYSLYDYLKNNNHDIEISKMEEGIFSYNYTDKMSCGKRVLLTHKINSLLRKKDAFNQRKKFYVLLPELVNNVYGYDLVKVDEIKKDSETVKYLNTIFDVNPIKVNKEYNKRYIFFGTVYKCLGIDIGEEEIVQSIANLVGYDNLIVKNHPRNNADFYIENGINVAKTSNVPWELIHMNIDCKEKVFITTLSQSSISSTLMISDSVKNYILCDLIKNKNAILSVANTIEKQINNLTKLQKNIIITSDLRDILS